MRFRIWLRAFFATLMQRHFRTTGGSVARQLQALERLKARISLAPSLPLLVLIVLLDPASRIPVAQAANITAPALHQKATQASDKVSRFWPSDPVLCDLVLEGVVQEGDAGALEKAFATIVSNANAFSFFLCLRSPGGDLAEAVKIAQFVLRTQRPSIATVVEDGQTCASSCAIIFLAGNAPARVGAWPQRFLHPRGKLLYHSSHLDLDQFTDKQLLEYLTEPTSDPRGLKRKIVDLHKGGLRDVQSVIATYQGFIHQREDLGDRWVRPSLFLEMFAQDPDEWICIDNVDTVGRWNIQVFGYRPPRAPTKQDYLNVCRNAYQWRSDEFAADARDDTEEGKLERPSPAVTFAGRNKGSQLFDDRVTMPFQATLAPLTCVIEIKYSDSDDTKKQLEAESTLTVFFMPVAGAFSQLAPTAFFPASKVLRDLPGVRPPQDRGSIRTRPAVNFTSYPNSLMNGCSYKSVPKVEREACEAACSSDSMCQAYSHNKITKACELKHTLIARRRDPLWTSGAPSTGPRPAQSARTDVMVTYYDLGQNKRFEGTLIAADKTETMDVCSALCTSDKSCQAVEYESSAEMCRRFSEVTGFQDAPPNNQNMIDAKIKRQR